MTVSSPLPGSKLVYYAPRDVLIPRVARQCIMRFCEGLDRIGVDVELVSLGIRLKHDEPTRHRSLWDVYGIERPFPLRILPAVSSQDSPQWLVEVQRAASYRLQAFWRYSVRGDLRRRERTIFYFRNLRSMAPLLALRRRHPDRVAAIIELHSPVPEQHGSVLQRVDGVVCISRALADDTRERFGLDPARITVAHTGVNLEAIERVRVSAAEARTRLGLPLDARIVAYTGKVHRENREIHLLLGAARRLPSDVLLVIVGERDDQVEHFRGLVREAGVANVRFTGFVAPADVPAYQLAADALVLYYPSEIAFNDYRSPAKLFEYLAAGRPIVASDYRSLHEVLDESCAVFVPPDRPEALASALAEVLADPGRSARLGAEALARAGACTWEARARHVAAFLRGLSPGRDRPPGGP